MKEMPLVSIVTINYKQAETTNQLLESLQDISYPNFETIVLDNNSGADNINRIKTQYRNVKLICNLENLGFSGANNVGIKASSGEFVLLLNNDTEVDPGFLEPMVELLSNEPLIGAVSPKIKYFNNPGIIQYAGFSKMNRFTLRMHGIGSKKPDNKKYDQLKETPYAHGCAMLVRREVINNVGMMPEEYFLYYEEHDWSESIRKSGYSIYYQPQSVVYHKESVSVQKQSELKTYYINRNRILFMRRNFNLPSKIVASIFILFISVPKNLLTYSIKREYGHLKAYLNAISWNISHFNYLKWKQ